jgi:hypothetical protein
MAKNKLIDQALAEPPAHIRESHEEAVNEARRRDLSEEPPSLNDHQTNEFYVVCIDWAWAMSEAVAGDPAWLFAKMLRGANIPEAAKSLILDWRKATTFKTNRKKLNRHMFTPTQYSLGVASDAYRDLISEKPEAEAITGALDAAKEFGGNVTEKTLKAFLNGRYRSFTLREWREDRRIVKGPKKSIRKRKKRLFRQVPRGQARK